MPSSFHSLASLASILSNSTFIVLIDCEAVDNFLIGLFIDDSLRLLLLSSFVSVIAVMGVVANFCARSRSSQKVLNISKSTNSSPMMKMINVMVYMACHGILVDQQPQGFVISIPGNHLEQISRDVKNVEKDIKCVLPFDTLLKTSIASSGSHFAPSF